MKTFLIALALFISFVLQAAPPPPDNDNFTNRIAIVASASISVQGRNASATTEPSEPTISGEIVYKSVWWSWTAPFDGPVTIDTANSSFDTLLGVFTGVALGALTSIAENDDSGILYTSSVSFNAIGGVPYVILVGGVNGAGGKVKLNITTASAPCAYAISPASRSFIYTTGSGSVTVTATTGCTWSAVSNDSWITIISGNTGSGNGTVSYSISANTAFTSRTGTLTIAGLTHTIIQGAAPACTYSISPTTANFSAAPVTNSFTMTAGTGCAWATTPSASWITIQSGISGSGNGTITYVLATNSVSNSRVGTITVAGLTHTITQAGSIPCTYSISPTSATFVSGGGSSNIVVSTQEACSWTAASPVSWVTFSTTNGTGNATVTYLVASNSSTLARSTSLTVANNSFVVSQDGAPCTYAIAPTSTSVSAAGASGTVQLTAGTGCAWTATSNNSWITITSGSAGSGNGTVAYTIAANTDTSPRAGFLIIGGQTFTVNQAAAACMYSISPTAAHYGDSGGSGSIFVTAGAGCAWTAVSNNGFITIDSGSPGAGNGTVAYTVAANATTTSRSGTITVAGFTFVVTQDGMVPCTYGITPSSATYTYIGGSGSVAVASNSGCAWSVSSGAAWITTTPAFGNGNGTVSYTVAANSSSLTRTGTVTIAGNIFTVTQTGIPCTYSISPTSATYTYTGGSGTVSITAPLDCPWTSSSDSSWLTVTTGSTGVGNGTLTYAVAASTVTTNRTGRLTVAGRTLVVTQTAAPCTYSISPTSVTSPDLGDDGTINITTSGSNCAWTVSTNQTWISVTPTSGTGNGSVSFFVLPNNQAAARSGTITISGQVFTITQSGDTTAPTVTLTAPTNGSTVSNVIALTATASDNLSVARVEFYRGAGTLLATDTTSPYSSSFNTTNVSNGSYAFYARAFDPANNQGFSATNTVTISNPVPTVDTNQWVRHFSNTTDVVGRALAATTANAVVTVGYFYGTANFLGTPLTSTNGASIYMVRVDNTGALVWAKSFGSTANIVPISIAIDSASGNIVVGGYFQGTANVGAATNIVSAGQNDMFIAVYNSSGTHQWSYKFGGTGNQEIVNSIAIDTAGNVIFTGTFQGTANFGGGNVSSTFNGPDAFIAKYSSAGSFVWQKTFTNNSNDAGIAILTDSGNNIILTGNFLGTLNLGGTNLVASGGDVFVAKFNSANAHTWSFRIGGVNGDLVTGLGLTTTGDPVITGTFSYLTDLGGGPLTASGQSDLFIAKYASSDGAFTWAQRRGGTGREYPNGLSIDSSGNIVIAGAFSGQADFGGGTISSLGPALDIFAAKYTSAGVFTWAKSFGGQQDDNCYSIDTDGSNNPVLTGSFRGSANFNGTTLVSGGGPNAYLLKIAP